MISTADLLSMEASAENLPKLNRWMIIIGMGLINAVEIANRTSLNVILPDLQGNVAANADEISWVLILYNIGFLCSLALSRWMTLLIGARTFFQSCILMYSIGAIGCFLSGHNLETLLVARLIMGFGGGAFLVRAVVVSNLLFPGKLRVVPWTVFLILISGFQVMYPPAMGAIADGLHWNYAFLIDFPFLFIGAAMLSTYLPRKRLRNPEMLAKPDLPGAGLMIGALATLQIALSRGERDLWFQSARISLLVCTGVLCLALFLWWDSRPDNLYPVLHLRSVWGVKSLRASFFLLALFGALLGSGLFVVPQYLRNVQDYSATQTGYFFSIYAAGSGAGSLFGYRFAIPKLGSARCGVLGFSALCLALMTFVYTWTPDTPGHILGGILFAQGFSAGLVLRSVSGLAVGQIALPDLPESDTVYLFIRQLGNSVGVSAAAILFDRRMTFHSSRMLDQANRLDPIVQSTLSQFARVIELRGGATSNPRLGAVQLFHGSVLTQTRLLSFVDISFCLAVLCVIGITVVLMMRLRTSRTGSHIHFIFQ